LAAFATLATAALFAGGAGAAPLYAEHDIAHAKKAIAIAQSSDIAYDLVASLTTEVGPRPAGSPNDAKAVAWAKARLTALGFDRVWTEPVKVDAWIRGAARADIVAPFPQHLAVAALGNSVSTPPEGINAEVAYYENFEALKNDSSDRAKGRIVFIDNNFKKSKDGRGYGQSVGGRFAGAMEASKRGAVAVMIRSVGTDRDRLPHTGAMRYDDKIPAIPAAAVSVPDAEMIARQVKSGKPVRISLSMKNNVVKAMDSANVLAEIRGSEKPDQIVAIGGHLDSWDLGTGAIDDGAGVAIMAAAAKIIKDMGVRPKRTIRVIFFANEENGLDGGRGYAAAHGKEKHQLVGESDLGSGSVFRMNTLVDDATLPWMREIAAVLAPLGVEAGENKGGDVGADVGALVRDHGHAGVALAQDASEYFDYHHTANDTLDKIDPVQLRQNVAAWVATIWLAAQADADFGGAPRKK
jgi:hypothetical protein